MVETFYVNLEFADKKGKNDWSINLPFLCTKCGICCKLEDFLTAGKTHATPQMHPELYAKLQTLYDELGTLWEKDETKYDTYTQHTNCPFLVDNTCTIYPIRPDGCRLFPHTTFGMDNPDCEPLTRFKKQKAALKKDRRCKETYQHTGTEPTEHTKPIKPVKFTEKQYKACIIKLHRTGITDDELALFHFLNGYKLR